ncbi:MAG: beta-N-acetylhexosaminidase [Acidobacteriota bacterium]|jgi:beta-N-acetylhexosaminidase|nr:beta-N-acetylhexosaminidase [Acidobacteriota bacterium]MDT5262501.1 beta-N-acetylhexosaminidase [Acidobacteriota bacterium]MDT7780398.1 beta-N-acetylhexosaminidase [Acidobacteriota bacterium]
MTDFQTLQSLPLEQQIGQLLYIGLPGTEFDSEARALVEQISPGGVIIFGRNVASPEQLRSLLDSVRAAVRVEPLFGIDQEGGLVDRVRKIFTPMPAARVIRQHGDLAAARAHGRITGEVLRLLGFNMNFAPVMSIMTEDRDLLSNGLYSRSFGRSPGEVLGYTMVYLRGLQGTGCLGCAKHFPGIGAGEVDTHEEMAVIHLTHDDLIAQDLAPYIELFQREDNMVKAVMISHGGFPNIDIHRGIAGGRLVPASINPSIVTGLLREELGYEGLVVTDDLEMGAIARHSEIEDAALRAILAGEDMILVCARPDLIRRAYQSLLDAAQRGELSRGRILASLRRISAFKALTKPPLPFDPKRLQELSSEVAELNHKLNYVYGGKL